MLEWTTANRIDASSEGWWLYIDPDPHLKKSWVRCSDKFYTTEDIHEHIIARGLEGSPLHLKALAILYIRNKSYFSRIMEEAPAGQTGSLVKTVVAMARMAGF